MGSCIQLRNRLPFIDNELDVFPLPCRGPMDEILTNPATLAASSLTGTGSIQPFPFSPFLFGGSLSGDFGTSPVFEISTASITAGALWQCLRACGDSL